MSKYFLVPLSSLLFIFSCNLKRENHNGYKKGDRQELKSDSGYIGITMPPSANGAEYGEALKYLEEGAPKKAISIYKNLCRVENDSLKTYAYSGLAAAYCADKDYKDAINCYNMSIKYDAQNSYAYIGLGSVYFELKDYKTAIRYYETELAHNNKSEDAYWGLALVYDALNDLPNAKANAKKFIELAPDSKYKRFADDILAK